jgi:uncharacterized protein YcsI (UPF0317 family)
MEIDQFNEQTRTSRKKAKSAREGFRSGVVTPTAGIARGITQANMISVPQEWAWDFLRFAQHNHKECPLLEVIDAGDYSTVLAKGADIRTDIPLYRIRRNGILTEEINNATEAWAENQDLVTFLIGCRFTFEGSLQDAGIKIRHIEDGSNVPLFLTNRLAVLRVGFMEI